MKPDYTLIERFVDGPEALFDALVGGIDWDRRIAARLTASFGRPYDYAGLTYAACPMPVWLQRLCEGIELRLGFRPDNCLVNYYLDGASKMGYHADDITELADDTGVAIVSLGGVRPLKFRRIGDIEMRHELCQPAGSLLYLPQDVHRAWVHAIPRQKSAAPRISLTFRKLREQVLMRG
ncbi:MAG: alpha-ketoglutarate-dependent dioxygenase AlkB [Proteobacteria bacterium]|nr:alpha-ketoglutarate-dependent dioxygenase AlkB [Pseudomonadota bacterium]